MAINKHLLPPRDWPFRQVFHLEKHWLEKVDVPVVTVAGTFMGEIKKHLGGDAVEREEVILSRAHLSQALAVLSSAHQMGKSFWLIDPLNYVSSKDWPKILLMEKIGQAAARIWWLKKLKDLFDEFARGKLPITQAIREPLTYVFVSVRRPIISFHYEAGNLLAQTGKVVLQVVTDPHVRPQYLAAAEYPNLFWAVFDEQTKNDLLSLAKKLGRFVSPKRVFVTGPPVDPRVVEARKNKDAYSIYRRPARLAILTGGLGGNKKEIALVVDRLLNCMKKGACRFQLIGYGGTQKDFEGMYQNLAKKHGVKMGKIDDKTAAFRVIYAEEENILEANEKLLKFVFPWADGLITKPSGDMAYDGVAAGCFLLFLSPWGEWEYRVHRIFEKRNIGMDLDFDHADTQINRLLDDGWMEQAIRNALDLPKLFLNGAENILKVQEKLESQLLK